MTGSRRCAGDSRERGEAQVGTASTVRTFLLVESPGPWGTIVPRDSRLPEQVRGWLESQRVRVLLIRRTETRPGGPCRVFLAREGRLRTTLLDRIEDVVDLDPGRDLAPYAESLYLVCTHGRHDACCAERGRPLWQAMAEAAPEHTWQVSHIGGDRFAANVLVLPDGLYYGRVEPHEAQEFVATHEAGDLSLDHLRGRCALPFPAQAAEAFLRAHLGRRVRDVPRVVSVSEESVVLEMDGAAWRVDVVRRASRELQTCRAEAPAEAWSYRLGGIERV